MVLFFADLITEMLLKIGVIRSGRILTEHLQPGCYRRLTVLTVQQFRQDTFRRIVQAVFPILVVGKTIQNIDQHLIQLCLQILILGFLVLIRFSVQFLRSGNKKTAYTNHESLER